jgi:hypothetical protein
MMPALMAEAAESIGGSPKTAVTSLASGAS